MLKRRCKWCRVRNNAFALRCKLCRKRFAINTLAQVLVISVLAGILALIAYAAFAG